MQEKKIDILLIIFAILILPPVTILFLNFPGTDDVGLMNLWVSKLHSYGAINGYKSLQSEYPPLSGMIALSVVRINYFLGGSAPVALRLMILFFLFLTSLVIWYWTKKIHITLIMYVSLLLSSVGHGYADVLFAPTLLLALWALKEQNITLFSILFTLSFLTKFQPLIIAPFIAVYLLNINQITHWKQIAVKKILCRAILPALTLVFLTGVIFNIEVLLKAFIAALNQNYLSGNALNFGWVEAYFLHYFFPNQFGPLINGFSDTIQTEVFAATFIPRVLFVFFYASTLWTFFRINKSFESLILFSLLGYTAYFIFNVSVHENHLFLATVISILLFWLNRAYLSIMIAFILMSNINHIVIYGIKGTGLQTGRVIGETLDIGLVFSLLYIIFFIYFWRKTLSHSKRKNYVNSENHPTASAPH